MSSSTQFKLLISAVILGLVLWTLVAPVHKTFVPMLVAQTCSSTTPNLGFLIPAYTCPNWNTLMNSNWSLLDAYLSGGQPIPGPVTVSGNLSVGGNLAVTGTSNLGVTNFSGAESGANFVTMFNNVMLLCYAKSASPITGTGSAAPLFSAGYGFSGGNCTIPQGIQAGKGIRISLGWNHSTGSASVTYDISIGGTSLLLATTSVASCFSVGDIHFFDDPGSQTSNAFWGSSICNTTVGSNFLTSAVNTTGSITVIPTFNVAATDQVTPDFFKVTSEQ
jgi:hypothetical protein